MQATFDLLFGAGGNSNAKLRYKTFKVQFPNLIKKKLLVSSLFQQDAGGDPDPPHHPEQPSRTEAGLRGARAPLGPHQTGMIKEFHQCCLLDWIM